MDLIEYIAARGGIVRTRALREAGFSAHAIARAVAAGRATRFRRTWIAIRGVDPILAGAAKLGIVVTCITQAARLGLWTYVDPADPHVYHVAASPHAGSVAVTQSLVHWSKPLIPRGPDALEDPIENVLAIIAECQPHERALATWDSAFNKGLVDRDSFSRFALRPAARRLLAEMSPFRDSGLETFIVTRLRWLDLPIRCQVWLYGHRVDVLIGDRLVLQADGGHHVGAQRASDNEHDAILRLHGYTVIRVTYAQIMDHWPEVQELILRAIAQGLHKAA
ncbi:endonuclease domain-containing protein [Microbacterium paludicola]|uniref:endonuclease domain-containing protein n=1 Tax=Microbacterium paludicola TaxID=300019 RepID=UPI0038791205